uniref:Uncharacterized protein n=1 Tax=Arundo donax TaxID=35708 RepID=A0A0A8YHJ8_ARUDO
MGGDQDLLIEGCTCLLFDISDIGSSYVPGPLDI